MRIVIAPDKFKGTLSAEEVARAMAIGARRALPSAVIVECPVADGGEGTLSALLRARGGSIETVVVSGPLGERIEAPLAFLDDGSVVVESAQASGLALLPPQRRDALLASSLGTGELVHAALERGASRVLVAVGGTASTDGGVGAAAALGWSFFDDSGASIGVGGGALRRLARVVAPPTLSVEGALVGACDVDVPLAGERGAARLFGPQKGAGPREVEFLEEGLHNLALRIREDVGRDVAELPHAGAGGGLGAGLVAFFGAVLHPGFDVVAQASRLHDRIESADFVLTGEGRLDRGTLAGKSAFGVARLASAAGVPCAVVAGIVDLPEPVLRDAGMDPAVELVGRYGRRAALDDPAGCIADATRAMVAAIVA